MLVDKVVFHGGMGNQFWNHYTCILKFKYSVNGQCIVGTIFLTIGMESYIQARGKS